MSPKSSSLLCLALLLALSSTIHAFDITKLLGQYPELGLFNQYITETKLADQINGRKTITILAVANSSLSSISGKSQDVIKAIISNHVILDYYDEKKIMSIQGSNNQLTTLYQASGKADKLQGFVNVDVVGEGEIAFGSAVKGAPMNAKLVKTVTTQPYDISVLQISEPIIAPGIDASSSSSSPKPAPAAKSPAPSKTPKTPAAESPKEAAAPVATPASAPKAAAPAATPASSPAAEAENAADAEASTPSSGASTSAIHMGVVGVVMGLASLLF